LFPKKKNPPPFLAMGSMDAETLNKDQISSSPLAPEHTLAQQQQHTMELR
jgi:hypothetical protein